MNSRNDAEQVVYIMVDGAAAGTDMAVVAKSITFTLNDGATDFITGDKFTITLTKNPSAASAVTADSGNTGNGTGTSVTVVGDVPNEVVTLKCIVAATNGGTFSVVGSKSGPMANLTVGTAFTHVYQQIAAGDEVLSALQFPDAGGQPTDRTSTITVGDGVITSTQGLSTANLMLVWRDVDAG